MNKRLKKKQNKSRINTILDDIPFKVKNVSFGSGYFIFSFSESSMCWFWLEQFPLWKFGIWLDEDKNYRIFGQAIASIDKFKPSASELSETNVDIFSLELYKIQAGHNDWKEYLIENDKCIEQDKIVDRINNRMHDAVLNFIEYWNDAQHSLEDADQVHIKLIDRNSKTCSISPRYQLNFLYDSSIIADRQKVFKLGWSAYDSMIVNLNNTISAEEEYYHMLESYIFTDFSTELLTENIYDDREKRYKWDKSFEKHTQELYDYNRQDYNISDKELEIIISEKSGSTEEIQEFLEDVYKGEYNVGYAKTLCFSKARKARKAREKAERLKEKNDLQNNN